MSLDPQTPARSEPVSDAARGALVELFGGVRGATERLCEGLSPEDCVAQSMPETSPIKWHLAHTSWFFETFVLMPRVAGYRPFHPEFSFLFNSYYNAVGQRVGRSQRGLITRPSVAEVMSYRRHVDEHVCELLGSANDIDVGVIELGCNHEQQHQELMLTDLKHLLSLNPLKPAYVDAKTRGDGDKRSSPSLESKRVALLQPASFIAYAEGLRTIGHAGTAFAFDNESPRYRVFVDAFELASRPVTNGEYLEFIADRGYERPELWLSEGWDAALATGWRAPLYWEKSGERLRSFTLAGMRDVDSKEPVCHVSYFEAEAFARWANARLPREAEWEIAASELSIEGNFLESGALHPQPTESVRSPAKGTRSGANVDTPVAMFGDVWEWTQSAYAAYPGYRPVEGGLGEYNGKFMVNQMVLRGGSCASPRSHMRATYRNFFHPHTRWQFSGIRLARDL